MRNLKWALLLLVVFCWAGPASSQSIKIKGSDTLLPLAERWAQLYEKKKPAVKLVVTGGGSSVGIAALLKGEIEIAESSRVVSESEKEQFTAAGKALVDLVVATDGVEILVNAANPVSELSMEQVRGIFSGTITNWKELGGLDLPIKTYGRESTSGTHAFMREHTLKGEKFVPGIVEFSSNAPMIAAVLRDPGGVAYAGLAAGKNSKHLRIKKEAGSPAIEPSAQNIAAGKYPLSRQLHWYLATKPSGDLKDLCEWVYSPEGQKIVESVGFVPLTPEARAAGRAHL